jgi:hypothetical protein
VANLDPLFEVAVAKGTSDSVENGLYLGLGEVGWGFSWDWSIDLNPLIVRLTNACKVM